MLLAYESNLLPLIVCHQYSVELPHLFSIKQNKPELETFRISNYQQIAKGAELHPCSAPTAFLPALCTWQINDFFRLLQHALIIHNLFSPLIFSLTKLVGDEYNPFRIVLSYGSPPSCCSIESAARFPAQIRALFVLSNLCPQNNV